MAPLRWLRPLLWGLAALLAATLLATAALVATGPGLALLVDLGTRHAGLEVADSDGRLTGPLRLRGVALSTGGLELRIGRLDLDWQPRALFGGELRIAKLHVDGLDITLPPAAPGAADAPPAAAPDLSGLPLAVAVDDLRITTLAVRPADAAPILADAIALQGQVDADGVTLRTLRVEAPQLQLAASGALGADGAAPLAIDLEWQSRLPDLPPLRGTGRISGRFDRLHITQRIDDGITATLDATVRDVLTAPTWEASVDLLGLAPHPLLDAVVALQPVAHLEASGDLQRLRATLGLDAVLPTLGATRLQTSVAGGLDGVEIESLRLQPAGSDLVLETRGHLDPAASRITLAGGWQQLRWPLDGDPAVQSPTGRFELDATPESYHATLDGALRVPGTGDFTAALELRGDPRTVAVEPFRLNVTGSNARLDGRARISLDEGSVDADGSWTALQWPLAGEADYISEQATWSLSGTPDDYRLQLAARLASARTGALRLELAGRGDPEQLLVERLVVQADALPGLRLDSEGGYRLADGTARLRSRWQGLQWPLTGDATVRSGQGSLELDGPLGDYRLRLEAALDGPGLPASRLELDGRGSGEQLAIDRLQADTLDGRLEADGRVTWRPSVAWQIRLQGDGINPGVMRPEWPGSLALQLDSDGSLADGTLKSDVRLERLSGTLVDQALQGEGQARIDGQRVTIDALQLQVGGSSLQLDGILEEQIKARFKLQTPDLAQLLPGSRGALSSSGTVAGPLDRPRIELSLEGRGLQRGAAAIDAIEAAARIDLAPGADSTVRLNARGVAAAGRRWPTIAVDGRGTPEVHRITLQADGETALGLRLGGGWDGSRWLGDLDRLTVDAPETGRWTQRAASRIEAAADRVRLGPLCLDSEPAALCLEAGWQPDGSAIRGDLKGWPTARLAAWLPETVGLDGAIEADFEARLPAGATPQGQVTARLNRGILRLGDPGEPLQLELQSLRVAARAEQNRADVEADLDLGGLGALRAALQVDDLDGERHLAGSVLADYHEQGLLAAMVPALREVAADLHADLTLGGKLAAPAVSGELRIENASADLPAAGIRLESPSITLRGSDREPLRLEGTVRSGDGVLELGGELQPATAAFRITARGERLTAMQTREVEAVVSPDLELSLDDRLLTVRGRIDVPRLHLQPRGLGTTATRSSDVVIVDAPEPPAPPMQVDARVEVTLGDDVQVRLPGLEARLGGRLEVAQEPGRGATATGSVELDSGNYEIFGQKLEITRGRVLYVGGPVGDPGLDLEAVRRVDDVTAGVRISGRAAAPDVKFFSLPAYPDSTVLSYLMFGRAPDARSGEEGALLAQAALALGMKGGNMIAGNLQKSAGLDVLEFERGDGAEQGALVVGKYLSPSLYISYGIGLFEPVNRFLVRYQLTERLSLESSSSGASSGTDLIYTLER